MPTMFITGASAGFGQACAELFARQGWRLILAARRIQRLERLQQQLGRYTEVLPLALDVRKRKAVEKTVADLPHQFQAIDALLNNAGLALGLEPAHETHPQDWETMVDTNIKGLMHCTRAILPGMVERNRGHIVNLGSIAGRYPYPGGNVYGATKAFVQQFSLNLRADLLGTKVRVTNIEPGLAETEFALVRFKGDRQAAANIYQKAEPLTASDIADIVHWVVSLPAHVNINRIEVMPTCQAWGPLAIHRQS